MADPQYPNMLAGGVGKTSFPAPFELYGGEADIVSDQIETGAVALAQFEIYALNELGVAVPWNPDAGSASGTVTFTGVGTAADTITINGVAITLVAAAPVGNQVLIGGTALATAQNLKTFINANRDALQVRASGDTAALTLTALAPGADGNAITLAEASTAITISGATLAGGTEGETESKPAGIAAQPIAANGKGPSYTGGIFNHEALIWPASVDTLALRKAAFAGTNIGVRKLL